MSGCMYLYENISNVIDVIFGFKTTYVPLSKKSEKLSVISEEWENIPNPI